MFFARHGRYARFCQQSLGNILRRVNFHDGLFFAALRRGFGDVFLPILQGGLPLLRAQWRECLFQAAQEFGFCHFVFSSSCRIRWDNRF